MRQGYTIGNRKVAIIGAGFVGSSIAYALALRDIAREIVLIDKAREKAIGEAWDIRHGLPIMGTADLYAGDYLDCRDCDLIIITADELYFNTFSIAHSTKLVSKKSFSAS